MNLYIGPSMTRLAPRLLRKEPWSRHIPFAYDLVGAARPRLILDLGESPEVSSFTFSQAVVDHALDALCYTVGAWPESGEPGEEPAVERRFDAISAFNRRHYVGFSYLVQMPFEQALQHFSADSVDLLHFDAMHSEDSVTLDVATWLPKVRRGGLFLLHGVKSVPTSLAPGAHGTFVFDDGAGLVVVRKDVPAAESADPALLRVIFGQDDEDQQRLRALYSNVAEYHLLDLELNPASFGEITRQKTRVRTG